MTFRDLRNKLVFYASAIGFFYVFKYILAMGIVFAILSSLGSAIVCVIVIALITDRFMS